MLNEKPGAPALPPFSIQHSEFSISPLSSDWNRVRVTSLARYERRPVMASYNKVFLMGNLTRDPQVKHLPSQMVVAEFGLAVNRRYKTASGEDKEEVAFVDCTAFG